MKKSLLFILMILFVNMTFAQKIQMFQTSIDTKKIFDKVLDEEVVSSPKAWTTPMSFEQATTTYTEITGGNVLWTGTYDDQLQSAVPIGFTFNYNGTDYTTLTVSANGYLIIGGVASLSYTPISSTTAAAGAIVPFGRDLINASTGSPAIRYETLGTAPDRIFVVQWKDAARYSSTTYPGEVLNFQARLYETTNVIELVYGPWTAPTASGTSYPQVGLRGATNADYNNRSSNTSWSSTTAGTINTAIITTNTTIGPVNGLVFRFNPPVPLDAGVSAITSPVNSLSGNYNIAVNLTNFGSTALTSCSIDLYVDNVYISSTPWTGNLALGQSESVTLETNYDFTTAGDYLINAVADLTNDMVSSNDGFSKTVTFYDPYEVPFSENFDAVTAPALPNFWNIENTNADAYYWQTSTTSPNSSPNCLYIRYNGSAAMNDWAFTPAINLLAGKTYKLSFKYRGYNTSTVEKLNVNIGTTATSAGMTTQIVDYNNILTATYTQSETLLTVSTDGIYYLGFHGYSAANMWYIYVDDVSLVEVKMNDAGITDIVEPIDGITGNYDVTVTLKNFGINTLTACDIDYDINGTTGTYSWTGSLAQDATEDVTILTSYDFTTGGTYNIIASTNLTGDEEPTNDQYSIDVNLYEPYTPYYFESFEAAAFPPTYWENYSTGSVYFVRFNAQAYDGAYSAIFDCYNASAGMTAELLTPVCYIPDDGTSTVFSFYANYYLVNGDYGNTAELYLDIYDAYNNLLEAGTVNLIDGQHGAGWLKNSLLMDTYVGQNIKFDFRAVSDYGSYRIAVDAVTLETVLAYDAAVTTTNIPELMEKDVVFAPVVSVINNGLNDATFDVYLDIYDKEDALVYEQTLAVTSLTFGSSLDLTFPDFTPTLYGGYSYDAYLVYTSDENVDNDYLSGYFTSLDFIYEQPGTVATGLTSQQFPSAPAFDGQVADDFIVPAGETFTVNAAVVYGSKSNPAADDFDSLNVYFYNDNAGLPGTLIAEYTIFEQMSFNNGVFTALLPETLEFTEGTYWVSFQAKGDFAQYAQWWFSVQNTITGATAVWQNPGNGFGTGYTTWTSTATTNGTARDAIYSLYYFEIIDATIDPLTAEYDLINPADVTTTITLNEGGWVNTISDGTYTLEYGVDYDIFDNGDGTVLLTIFDSYLAANLLAADEFVDLEISFYSGASSIFTVTAIADVVDATINPTSANFDIATPANVTTTVTWGTATGISSINDGTADLIENTDYTLVGNDITILSSYLATNLTVAGESVVLTISFEGFSADAVFTVNAIETGMVPQAGTLAFETTDLGLQYVTAVDDVYNLGDICDTDMLELLAIQVIDDEINETTVDVFYNSVDFGDMVYNSTNDVWAFVPGLPFNWTEGVNTLTTTFVDADANELFITVQFNYVICTVQTAPITFVVDDSQGMTYTGFAIKGSWNVAGEYDNTWGGGVEHSVFYDDGTNGDVTAGDHIWSVTINLVPDGGTNTWEWGFNDDGGNWIPTANQQFTVADATAQTLTYAIPVGINELQNSVNVYPNPSNGLFTLTVDGQYTAKVFDVTGRIVSTTTINAVNNTIDLSAQNSGMYFIQLVGKNIFNLQVIVK